MPEKNQKSFLQSLSWVGIMLLAMGLVFSGIGLIVQILPLDPADVVVSINGVRQPPTEETLHTFRLIFLLVFGIIGLGLFIPGGIVAVRGVIRRNQIRYLKEAGTCITATVTGRETSNVRVNNRRLERLRCSYIDPYGVTHVFKSGYLRNDPTPYLNEGKVFVYHDPYDMGRYFVDVDGSIGLGTRLLEV